MMKKYKYLIYSLFLLLQLSCIVRNNPWDPVNGCPEELKNDYRSQYKHTIDSLNNEISAYISKYDKYLSLFPVADSGSKKIFKNNDSIIVLNSSVDKYNDSVENYNSECFCAQLLLKLPYENIDTVAVIILDSLEQFNDKVRGDSVFVVLKIGEADGKCHPLGVFSNPEIDIMLTPAINFSKKQHILDSIQKFYSGLFTDTNVFINDYNKIILAKNNQIDDYNDSIAIAQNFITKKPVTDIDTLIKKIDSISSGDTVFLSSGYFRNSYLNFKIKADSTKPVVITGSPFMNTYLDSMNIVVAESRHIRFENLIFQNAVTGGHRSGIKIEANSHDIRFKNCVFRNNPRNGIEVAASSVQLDTCIVMNNNEGGIKIVSGDVLESVLSGTNLLVVKNGDFGIYSTTAVVRLLYSTISDNATDGVFFNVPRKQSTFYSTIFSFNGRCGVAHDNTEATDGTVQFYECDFYQNTLSALDIPARFVSENADPKDLDPGYINRAEGNYRLSDTSSLKIGYHYPQK